jgi:hypothetical protein
LTAAGIQERIAEVVEIQSKYVHRFQESMQQFQIRFPEREDLQLVRLTNEATPEGGQLDPTPIFASLDKRKHHVEQAISMYRSSPTPVNVLSRAVGRNLFETLNAVTRNPEAGVRWCCDGNLDEREMALRSLRGGTSIVLDVTALYTICQLDLTELLRRWDSHHVCLSQGTFDKVRDIMESESKRVPSQKVVTSSAIVGILCDRDRSFCSSMEAKQCKSAGMHLPTKYRPSPRF